MRGKKSTSSKMEIVSFRVEASIYEWLAQQAGNGKSASQVAQTLITKLASDSGVRLTVNSVEFMSADIVSVNERIKQSIEEIISPLLKRMTEMEERLKALSQVKIASIDVQKKQIELADSFTIYGILMPNGQIRVDVNQAAFLVGYSDWQQSCQTLKSLDNSSLLQPAVVYEYWTCENPVVIEPTMSIEDFVNLVEVESLNGKKEAQKILSKFTSIQDLKEELILQLQQVFGLVEWKRYWCERK